MVKKSLINERFPLLNYLKAAPIFDFSGVLAYKAALPP